MLLVLKLALKDYVFWSQDMISVEKSLRLALNWVKRKYRRPLEAAVVWHRWNRSSFTAFGKAYRDAIDRSMLGATGTDCEWSRINPLSQVSGCGLGFVDSNDGATPLPFYRWLLTWPFTQWLHRQQVDYKRSVPKEVQLIYSIVYGIQKWGRKLYISVESYNGLVTNCRVRSSSLKSCTVALGMLCLLI